MPDFYIEGDELRVKLPPGAMSRLYVDGGLQAEFGLGASGPEDFAAELSKARAAQAACRMMRDVIKELDDSDRKSDHRVKQSQKSSAYAEGLRVGLLNEHLMIGADPMHGIKPSRVPPDSKLNGPTFTRGWSLGSAINAAIEISLGNRDPRRAKPRRKAKP